MPPKITAPEIHTASGNGIYIGPGADQGSLVITNPTISKCSGHGIMVAESSNAEITFPKISDVGQDGIHVFSDDLISKIGLPENTDKEQLKELLALLQKTPDAEREKIIKSSFLADCNNLTSIANNIMQILINLPTF